MFRHFGSFIKFLNKEKKNILCIHITKCVFANDQCLDIWIKLFCIYKQFHHCQPAMPRCVNKWRQSQSSAHCLRYQKCVRAKYREKKKKNSNVERKEKYVRRFVWHSSVIHAIFDWFQNPLGKCWPRLPKLPQFRTFVFFQLCFLVVVNSMQKREKNTNERIKILKCVTRRSAWECEGHQRMQRWEFVVFLFHFYICYVQQATIIFLLLLLLSLPILLSPSHNPNAHFRFLYKQIMLWLDWLSVIIEWIWSEFALRMNRNKRQKWSTIICCCSPHIIYVATDLYSHSFTSLSLSLSTRTNTKSIKVWSGANASREWHAGAPIDGAKCSIINLCVQTWSIKRWHPMLRSYHGLCQRVN